MGLREEKREAAWLAIRDAAWALFAQRGFDQVSVEEIADAAEISRTTFFNYFGTKEAVVLDPAPADVRRLASLLADQAPERSPWSAISTVLLALSRASHTEIEARRRLVDGAPALAHHARELTDDLAGQLRTWMRTRLPDDPLGADLVVDLALASMATAWSGWAAQSPVAAYLDRLETCLERAAPDWAR